MVTHYLDTYKARSVVFPASVNFVAVVIAVIVCFRRMSA